MNQNIYMYVQRKNRSYLTFHIQGRLSNVLPEPQDFVNKLENPETCISHSTKILLSLIGFTLSREEGPQFKYNSMQDTQN